MKSKSYCFVDRSYVGKVITGIGRFSIHPNTRQSRTNNGFLFSARMQRTTRRNEIEVAIRD